MSSFLNNFTVFRYLPQELKNNIKLFHVFRVITFCITNDKVYGLGDKINQYVDYGNNNNNFNHIAV